MSVDDDIRDIKNHMIDQVDKQGKMLAAITGLKVKIEGIDKRLESGDRAFEKMEDKLEACQTSHAEKEEKVDERLDPVEAALGFGENVPLKNRVENVESTISGWKKIIALVIGLVTLFSQFIVQGLKSLWTLIIAAGGEPPGQ